MQFGFGAPVSGPLSGPRDLTRIASQGEAMGYDYCTISDHVMIPRDIEAKYPYSDTGEFPGRAGGDRHEQLTTVTFVAAKTSKLRLVTSVTVVPHRPPVLTAKTLATIDVLSEGRFTWGIGVGWCKEEFEAVGTEPFEERGAVTDETIAQLALCDVNERLIHRLVGLAREEGASGPDGLVVRRRPTQQELANMIGSCRETISRAFNQLARDGLIIPRGRSLVVTPALIERAEKKKAA
jgi:alkanesulfonate monooxygenase SsuD/methylene tetrahydromethanopterin reductase-like flavin-dependent oxidoreductase (luciferase family)